MNRRISVYTTGLAVPQSFITKGKQRLKQHIDTVYLNDGDEFEIELYNPTQNKVLAQIELNGNSIGSGIILRPGERVFLERHLNEPKKFLFETYFVDGDNKEIQQAVARNGDVTIKFYEEHLSGTSTITTYYPSSLNLINKNDGYTLSNTTISGTYRANSTYTSGTNTAFYNANLTSSSSNSGYVSTNTMETGRVEAGSNSNQKFEYDSASFKSYPSWTNWWKLKPQSTKPIMSEDLIVYCTECGSKRKKDSHKFCPHCGTKY